MPSKYVTVAGTPTNYYHTGRTTLPTEGPRLDRGAVLLFLHAAGSNAHTWHRTLAHVGERHSALAPDFPGHGRSGGLDGLGSIEAYRDFTAAFAGALTLPPAIVVGRSMGGAVAMALAVAHPERVRALVLVATAARFEIPAERLETWRNVSRGRVPQPFTTDGFSPQTDMAVMRELWMEQVKTDPRVRYQDLRACAAVDLSSELPRIRQPALIVAGRDDAITPPACAEQLGAAIPNARLVVIDNAGHHLPSEQPAAFHAALDEFLDRTEPSDRSDRSDP
jgi:pimeloyl-ACP methyl ester carboxylesterase